MMARNCLCQTNTTKTLTKNRVRNILINVNSYYDNLASSYPCLCIVQKLIQHLFPRINVIKKLLLPKIPYMLIPNRSYISVVFDRTICGHDAYPGIQSSL
jgi:hypothetical protein